MRQRRESEGAIVPVLAAEFPDYRNISLSLPGSGQPVFCITNFLSVKIAGLSHPVNEFTVAFTFTSGPIASQLSSSKKYNHSFHFRLPRCFLHFRAARFSFLFRFPESSHFRLFVTQLSLAGQQLLLYPI